MMDRAGRDAGSIAFAEQLLTVLAEGSFTATYKYAVILALVDLCLEYSTRSGAAPASVTTRQLAEKVLAIYWPHARAFRTQVLRQNAGHQAGILTLIARFQDHSEDESAPAARARHLSPDLFARLVRDVEWVLVKMPLPKLQRVGREIVPVIYQINWGDDIRRGTFIAGDFDNLIRFVGDAGNHLLRLAPLLRPLVQREWSSMVARINDLPEAELDRFLFGARRQTIAHLAVPLGELQHGKCFYCERPLGVGVEVDHFVPWSRHPDDGLDNLVAAHGRCNGQKRDHLASAEHAEHWATRTLLHGGSLSAIADAARWPREPERTIGVARSIYLGLHANARLWHDNDHFVTVDVDSPLLNQVFATPA